MGRLASHAEVELSDLVSPHAVLEWEAELKQTRPAFQKRNGERLTDIVPACPMYMEAGRVHDLSMFLEMLTLSVRMRSQNAPAHDRDSLLSPLVSLEFADSDASTKSHFGSLLEDRFSKWKGDHSRASHEIHPLLITTFSDPQSTLAMEAVQIEPKVLSEIHMENTVSQVALRELMKQHVEQVLLAAPLLSVLHVHVNMKQYLAQDIVDYLRFQVEWLMQEMMSRFSASGTSCLHIVALVVHAIRGSAAKQSIRPFLLAGPRVDGQAVKVVEWTGAAVDHFSHMLPWGMPSAALLHGTVKEIFGIGEESTDRFRFILADALPHIVPRFRLEHQADSFVVVQTLMHEIHRKPELVRCIRTVLAEQLSLEQARGCQKFL